MKVYAYRRKYSGVTYPFSTQVSFFERIEDLLKAYRQDSESGNSYDYEFFRGELPKVPNEQILALLEW